MYKGEWTQHLLRVGARWVIALSVTLSPWLFGAAEPWACLLICSFINIGFGLWWISYAAPHGPRLSLAAAAAPAAVLLALIVLQFTPLPRAVVARVNPRAAEAHAERNRVLAEMPAADPALEPGPRGGPFTLSVAPSATRRSLYVGIACLGILTVTSGIRRPTAARALAACVVAGGFALALFAMIQSFTGTRLIYWVRERQLAGTFFGPFTNRNHFAAHANLAIGLALALLLQRTARRFPRRPGGDAASGASSELGKAALLLFAAAIMACSVLLSLSRGGMAGLLAALGIAGAVLARRAGPRRALYLAVAGLLAVGIVVWIGWAPVLRRLGTMSALASDPLRNARVLTTIAALQTWLAYPWTGCGLGAFEYAFPPFQLRDLPRGRLLHAHNDYAELLATVGVAGAVVAAWLAVALIRAARNRFRTAPEEGRLFFLGAMVGLAAIALHSIVDFSLHKPANAFLLALVCGVSFAALRPGAYDYSPVASTLRLLRRPVTRRLGVAGAAALALLTLIQWGELRSEMAYARYRQWLHLASEAADPSEVTMAVESACREADAVLRYSQGNADTLMEVASQGLRWLGNQAVKPATKIRLAQTAGAAARRAVAAAPSSHEGWLWLGRAQAVLGQTESARQCLERAWRLGPPGIPLERLP